MGAGFPIGKQAEGLMNRRWFRICLSIGVTALLSACAGTPTAWDEALDNYPDIAEPALRLANDPALFSEEYDGEYSFWSRSSSSDCDSLQESHLVALDEMKQNASDSLAGREFDHDGVPISVSDDLVLARMTAIAVVKAELECFS